MLSTAFLSIGLKPNTPKLIDKCKEIIRLLNIKLPNGAFGKLDRSRHIIAIDLACVL